MNIKSKQIYLLGLVSAFIVMLYGCYPKGPEYTSDYALVVTDYDPDYDFGVQKTYFMPDTVFIETNIEDPDLDKVKEFQDMILDLVETNMSNKNYTRIDTVDAQIPDMVMNVSALLIDNTGVGWVPSPCWSYWCWWYGGGWYPYYYSYSTGTVLIQLGDPVENILDDEVEASLSWIAGLDGLLSSNVNNNIQGVTYGINQAFEQSPYLESNQ